MILGLPIGALYRVAGQSILRNRSRHCDKSASRWNRFGEPTIMRPELMRRSFRRGTLLRERSGFRKRCSDDYRQELRKYPGSALFDLDGVSIHSTPVVTGVWSQWAREHGSDPDELVARVHGCPSMTTIANRFQMPIMQQKPRSRTSRAPRPQGVFTLPGVLKLLASLPASRWKIDTSGTIRWPTCDCASPAPSTSALHHRGRHHHREPDPEPYLKVPRYPACTVGPHRCRRCRRWRAVGKGGRRTGPRASDNRDPRIVDRTRR